MNENESGTRSFEPIENNQEKNPVKKNVQPDWKKITLIAILAVLTAVLVLFCVIIIVEVACRKEEQTIKYTTFEIDTSKQNEGVLLVVNSKNNKIDASVKDNIKESVVELDNANRHYSFQDNGKKKTLTQEAANSFYNMVDALYREKNCASLLLCYGRLDFKAETSPERDYIQELGTSVYLKLYIDQNTYPLKNEPDIDKWMTDNAPRFGFYNTEKTDNDLFQEDSESGRAFAQFRYVGVPHAKYLSDNSMSLTDYVAMLKGSHNSPETALTITTATGDYLVYYAAASSEAKTEIKIPDNRHYTYSGDNIGGFIVTVFPNNK